MFTFVLSSINVVTVRPSRFQRAPALGPALAAGKKKTWTQYSVFNHSMGDIVTRGNPWLEERVLLSHRQLHRDQFVVRTVFRPD